MKSIKLVLLSLLLSVCSFAQATYTTQYTTYKTASVISTILTTCKAGTASGPCWQPLAGISGKTITSIATGQKDKTLWAVTSDHHAYMHTPATNTWVDKSANKAGSLAQIAVVNATTAYARSTLGHNLQYNFSTNAWNEITNDNYPPASGTALVSKDLAVGADGDMWAVGSDALGCGFRLYHRAIGTNSWASTAYSGTQVGVANQYSVWSKCSDNSVDHLNFGAATQDAISGAAAQYVSAGNDGYVVLTSTTAIAGGYTPEFITYDSNTASFGCCNKTNGGLTQVVSNGAAGVYGLNNGGAVYFFPLYVPVLSETVQGTTTCAGQGCPGQLGTGTQHTGTVSIKAPGNSSAQLRSQAVTWSSYLQVTSQDTGGSTFQGQCDADFDFTGLGCGTGFDESAGITCPFMGSVLSSANTITVEPEIAFTTFVRNGPVFNCTSQGFFVVVCDNPVAPYCSAATTPPDFILSDIRDTHEPVDVSGWEGVAICVRIHYGAYRSGWACGTPNGTPFPLSFYGNLPYTPGNCTSNP